MARFPAAVVALAALTGASRAYAWTGGYSPYGNAALTSGSSNSSSSSVVYDGVNTVSIPSAGLNLHTTFPNANYIKLAGSTVNSGGQSADTLVSKIQYKATGGTAGQTVAVNFLVESKSYALAQHAGTGTAMGECSVTLGDADVASANTSAQATLAPSQTWGNEYHKTTNTSDSGVKRCLVSRSITFNAAGEAVIDFPFTVHIGSAITSVGTPSGFGSGEAYVKIVRDMRSLGIYSIPDPKWPSNGNPIGITYRKGNDLGYCDDFGPVFERLENVRNSDGSITVDTIPYFHYSNYIDYTGGAYWRRLLAFQASASSFTQPAYTWTGDGSNTLFCLTTNPGDLLTASDPSQWVPCRGLASSPTGLADPAGIDLGGSPRHHDFARSSTVTVKATDSDGLSLQNTYKIRWHAALDDEHEDVHSASNLSGRYIINGADYDLSAGDGYHEMGMSSTVTVHPRSIWWTIADGGSTLLSAAAPVAFFTVEPPAGDVVSLALTAANIGITSIEPTDDNPSYNLDYAKWHQAVELQHDKNVRAANGETIDLNEPTYFPGSLADAAYSTLVSANSADPANATTGDATYRNYRDMCTAQLIVRYPWTSRPWIGDRYGEEGYQRTEPYYIKQGLGFDPWPMVKLGS